MRTLLFFVFLFLSLLFLFSCQKGFEAPQFAQVDTTIVFKAKIDGQIFSAVLSGATIRPDSVISIAGQSADGQILAFTLKDSGIHVYDLDMNSTSNFCGYTGARNFAYSTNQGYQPGDAGGKLAIISLDRVKRLISGIFNFKVYREEDKSQRIVTEGIFNNIRY